MQIGIFECTGIMGQDLVHPYIQSTIVLCDIIVFVNITQYTSTLHRIMAIHNIERCRDGCRASLLIAEVALVPAIFHTLLPPCHPYIIIHFMEIIFSTNFVMHTCCLIKKAVSIVSCIQIPTLFSWYKPASY